MLRDSLAFPALVSLGVAVGHAIIVNQVKRSGLDVGRAHRLVFSIVAAGFAAAVAANLLYYPERFAADASNRTLPIGLSSFGGLLGAIAGAVGYFRVAGLSGVAAWRYWNLVGYAFPFGWTFGRLGCSVVHDHPGIRASGLFTHAFPDGQRYDLGRIELVLFVLPVTVWFWWLKRRPGRPPNFPALFLLLYGPFRLLLDLLNQSPPRYWGITVDQMGSVTAVMIGLVMLRRARF